MRVRVGAMGSWNLLLLLVLSAITPVAAHDGGAIAAVLVLIALVGGCLCCCCLAGVGLQSLFGKRVQDYPEERFSQRLPVLR